MRFRLGQMGRGHTNGSQGDYRDTKDSRINPPVLHGLPGAGGSPHSWTDLTEVQMWRLGTGAVVAVLGLHSEVSESFSKLSDSGIPFCDTAPGQG